MSTAANCTLEYFDKESQMHKLAAVVLIGAALGASVIHAQTAPAGGTTRSIKAVQPGLF
jgi:hypothetical protein